MNHRLYVAIFIACSVCFAQRSREPSYHPTRNGLVVTAGGLICMGTFSDRTVRALDKDTRKVLWDKELESGPEGIPAVYEVNGREYVAFAARTGRIFDNIGSDFITGKPGRPEAQSYYVFTLRQ